MISPSDQTWKLHSAQEAYEGHTISVRVNSRFGVPGWLIDVHVTRDGSIVATQLRASTHATAGEAVAFGVELGHTIVEALTS